jgi:hypothetical protein
MVLIFGNTKKLAGKDWNCIEFSAAGRTEEMLRQVCKEVPEIFKGEALEIFVPPGADMALARSTSLKALAKLRSVQGCHGLLTSDGTPRMSKIVMFPDADVQRMIAEARETYKRWAADIVVGAFVRVADGEARDYAGTITRIEKGRATVCIPLKSKTLIVDTPVGNLRALAVPPSHRVFYYVPALDGVDPKVLAGDLKYVPVADAEPEPRLYYGPVPLVPHGQRMSYHIRELRKQGKSGYWEIAEILVDRMRKGEVRKPKSWSVFHAIMKLQGVRSRRTEHSPTRLNERFPELGLAVANNAGRRAVEY